MSQMQKILEDAKKPLVIFTDGLKKYQKYREQCGKDKGWINWGKSFIDKQQWGDWGKASFTAKDIDDAIKAKYPPLLPPSKLAEKLTKDTEGELQFDTSNPTDQVRLEYARRAHSRELAEGISNKKSKEISTRNKLIEKLDEIFAPRYHHLNNEIFNAHNLNPELPVELVTIIGEKCKATKLNNFGTDKFLTHEDLTVWRTCRSILAEDYTWKTFKNELMSFCHEQNICKRCQVLSTSEPVSINELNKEEKEAYTNNVVKNQQWEPIGHNDECFATTNFYSRTGQKKPKKNDGRPR